MFRSFFANAVGNSTTGVNQPTNQPSNQAECFHACMHDLKTREGSPSENPSSEWGKQKREKAKKEIHKAQELKKNECCECDPSGN